MFADLVVTSTGNVGVLLGNGDGTFQSASNHAADYFNASVAVADFNGDGIPDLVVAFNLSSVLSVQLNKGDGTFERHQKYDAGRLPIFVAVGDFNGDGRPDLAVVNQDAGTITILVNNGVWP